MHCSPFFACGRLSLNPGTNPDRYCRKLLCASADIFWPPAQSFPGVPIVTSIVELLLVAPGRRQKFEGAVLLPAGAAPGAAPQNPVTPSEASQNPEGLGCEAQNCCPAAVRVLARKATAEAAGGEVLLRPVRVKLQDQWGVFCLWRGTGRERRNVTAATATAVSKLSQERAQVRRRTHTHTHHTDHT